MEAEDQRNEDSNPATDAEMAEYKKLVGDKEKFLHEDSKIGGFLIGHGVRMDNFFVKNPPIFVAGVKSGAASSMSADLKSAAKELSSGKNLSKQQIVNRLKRLEQVRYLSSLSFCETEPFLGPSKASA